MATNHQVLEAALAAMDRRPIELPDFDCDMANPVHDDDDGEGLGDALDDLTPEELDELAAGPPWMLALLPRCFGCDSRAELVGALCSNCRESSAPVSHPSVTLDRRVS